MSAASKKPDEPIFEIVLADQAWRSAQQAHQSGRERQRGQRRLPRASCRPAKRVRAGGTIEEIGELITGLNSCQASRSAPYPTVSRPRRHRDKGSASSKINGARVPDLITRTSRSISYRPINQDYCYSTYDQKAMPPSVRKRIDDVGGLRGRAPHRSSPNWPAPAPCCARRPVPACGGPIPANASKVPAACTTTSESSTRPTPSAPCGWRTLRAWLVGFGWMIVGKGGALLKRSIMDRMVGGAERIAFEGAPGSRLDPLCQDPRPAMVTPGALVDTRAALRELSLLERTRLKDLDQVEKHRLKPDAEKARAKFVSEQATVIAARTGGTNRGRTIHRRAPVSRRAVAGRRARFRLDEFAGCTVADVLADPRRFEGATLADPVEGVEYGRGKAKVLLRDDGAPWINSFAHGRTFYSLKYDAAAIETAMAHGVDTAAPDIAVRMLANAEVSKTDEDRLIGIAAKRSKVSKTAIRAHLKDLRTAAAKGGRPQHAPTPSLPEIVVRPGLRHEAADAGIIAVHAANVPFYQRAGGLVRVCSTPAKTSDGKETHVPAIVPVAIPILGRALNTSANWWRVDEHGDLNPVDCPWGVVEEIGAMAGHWPFPALAGVIGTPTMRMDGSLLCAAGYDSATGLYMHEPPPMPAIPERPTRQDALTALALLLDLLTDFPFVDRVSRSVALSMLMTPVLRAALGPAVPTHALSAPTPGTGKSYLTDTASAIALGDRCPVISVAPKEEETEKRLITAALAGRPIISLDNHNGVLTGDFLCQVTERPRLLLRPLGASKDVEVPNTFTCYVNGNNIVIAGDMTRRVVRCLLDANVEDPLKRTFSGNPVKTVLADRGRYIAAILTIARACIAAKFPSTPHLVPSYEKWSGLVCGS